MRLTDLYEADDEKSTKTKTKNKTGLDQDSFFKTDDKPLAKKDDDTSGDAEKPKHGSPKGVSKAETDDATSGIHVHPDAAKHFANLHKNMPTVGLDDTEHSDIVVHVPASKLPAHLETALEKAGQISVRWHHVANLPGNAAAAIRQLGKALFGALTQTKTDQITMIGNLGGQGKPNSEKEVQAVAAYLKKFGEDMGPGHIDFDNVMPGYKAQIHHYVAFGTEFMLVKDFAGSYIYAWPVDDSKNGKIKKLAN